MSIVPFDVLKKSVDKSLKINDKVLLQDGEEVTIIGFGMTRCYENRTNETCFIVVDSNGVIGKMYIPSWRSAKKEY